MLNMSLKAMLASEALKVRSVAMPRIPSAMSIGQGVNCALDLHARHCHKYIRSHLYFVVTTL